MILFFILFLIVVAYVGFKIGGSDSSKWKGAQGEAEVRKILNNLPQEQYLVLNDIVLQGSRGITQIDHVVVSIYGIFVIETKNYTGWITGSEYGEQWTKNMYGKKYPLRNPIKQNYVHIKALQELLQLKEDKFISVVVFSPKCEIKVRTNKIVIYSTQLRAVIDSYKVSCFSAYDMKAIADRIWNAAQQSDDVRNDHVRQIKEQVRDKNVKVANGICPRCGGTLVWRTGRYGAFWGCSNYPRCRYTHKG